MTISLIVRKPGGLQRKHPAPCTLALAGFLAASLASSAAGLAAQQVRFNLRPTVTWTEWDETLGFGDARSLGVSAGLGFGEYVDLAGYFKKSDDRSTHLSSLPFAAGVRTPLADQHLQIASYGAEVTMGLTRGSFVPVLMGGAGVLRFRPEVGDEIQRVQLKYGFGFRTRVLDAFEGEVMVARSRYYLDPLDLAVPVSVGDPALPEDPGAGALRRNLSLRVGLGLQLGGRDDYGRWEGDRDGDQRYWRSSSRAALTLEPFGGGQAFDDGFGIEDQGIAGFRTGLDIGRSLGLRGFYWRGVEDGYDSWDGDRIRGYGGEAQFNLGGLAAFSSHLLAGAGRMEFGSSFARDREGVPADRTTLILGGGIELGLGRHLRLTAAARDYIMSGPNLGAAAASFGDVKDPQHLVHNWQMSAGLKIVVGGDPGPSRDRPRARWPGAAAFQADRERGVAVEGVIPDTALTRDDLAAMEARLAELMESRLDDMERRMDETGDAEADGPEAPGTPVGPGAPAQPDAPEAPGVPAPEGLLTEPGILPTAEPIIDEPRQDRNSPDPSLEFPKRELRPYTGVQVGSSAQWVYGVAVDWGPSGRFPSFNVVPEASLGLGQGKPTWMVAANLQYRLRGKIFERDSYWISPVASFGPGLLNEDGTELVLNASYGVHVQLRRVRRGGGEPISLYVAHQGLDLFERNRLILGLSLER